MASTTVEQLQARFGIHGVVSITSGQGGLTRLSITTPQSTAEIYTHGAHVTAFQPNGQPPVLWISEKSNYVDGKPIRGGVPVIFPWFGPKADDPKALMHGLVRTAEWELTGVQQEGSSVLVTLEFSSSPATLTAWPFEFHLRFDIRVGMLLEMALTVENRSAQPFDFEEALHTYFTVSDVRQIRISGLEKTAFIDKTDSAREKLQNDQPITITAETDRVYLDTQSTCVVHDPGHHRQIFIEKTYSNATVVWNPWIAKSKAMADFGDEEWPGMLCVETTNCGPERVMLLAGDKHTMTATIRSVMLQ